MSRQFHKEFGCPVGSMVIGDGSEIERPRWLRKMLGKQNRLAGCAPRIHHDMDRRLEEIIGCVSTRPQKTAHRIKVRRIKAPDSKAESVVGQ